MPTVTLHAGTVAMMTSGTGGSLTGSGALWDDGSDSTYLESKTPSGAVDAGQAEAPLDTLTLPSGATVTAITANIRVQKLTASDTPAHVGITLWPASHLAPQFAFTVPDTDVAGWSLDGTTAGTITDLSSTINQDQLDFNFVTFDDVVGLLESGTAYITARAQPSPPGPTHNNVQVRVYELSIDVTYVEAIDLPCNTWVDIPLSDAVILTSGGDITGIYDGDVIYGNEIAGTPLYPEICWPGVQLAASSPYLIESTYDPTSVHDLGGRLRIISSFRPGFEQSDLDDGDSFGGLYDGHLGSTDDTLEIRIGPGIILWDDPDFGVAAGYTTFAFESDRIGALSAIRIKKLCAFGIPPLRLTNRRDQFSSAPSLVNSGDSRQGGNRLTGYL